MEAKKLNRKKLSAGDVLWVTFIKENRKDVPCMVLPFQPSAPYLHVAVPTKDGTNVSAKELPYATYGTDWTATLRRAGTSHFGKRIKLTKSQKENLRAAGNNEGDLKQIEDACLKKNTKYSVFESKNGANARPATREEVIEMLGMDKYISGISRSAFHGSAVVGVGDKDELCVYFETRW